MVNKCHKHKWRHVGLDIKDNKIRFFDRCKKCRNYMINTIPLPKKEEG